MLAMLTDAARQSRKSSSSATRDEQSGPTSSASATLRMADSMNVAGR